MEREQIALRRAIKIIGSQRKLASKLGVSFARLNHWVNLGIEVPPKFAMRIEILTEGEILAQDLCMDCRYEFIDYKKFNIKKALLHKDNFVRMEPHNE